MAAQKNINVINTIISVSEGFSEVEKVVYEGEKFIERVFWCTQYSQPLWRLYNEITAQKQIFM